MYKIFASIIDDETRKQVEELSKSEAYSDCEIRVMPDCHAGKGCTIGSVIQIKDRIVPNTVGVDIGCGMLVCNLGDVNVNLEELDHIINSNIPSGFNVREEALKCFSKDFIADIHDWDYIQKSLGTLGGGNHFIELDIDENNNKYLVIHSGSRNLGVQVCNYWQDVAISKLVNKKEIINNLIKSLKEQGREKEIQSELKKLQFPKINEDLAYLEGVDLENYLHDMQICQKFASDNRRAMATIILRELGLSPINMFETIHNYLDVESKIIRKGAIRADKDEIVIIPMNMRDGSLICVGKGNEDWLCSAPHGAGRIMSRKQALESIDIDDFKNSMNGIYSTSICESTKDEAPMVYKPIDTIVEDIKDTVEIINVVKPIYNFKAK